MPTLTASTSSCAPSCSCCSSTGSGSNATVDRGADRRLVAAAVVFGLALGDHSLVLLFAPGIVLFVLAVAPDILRRRRLVAGCLAAFGLTLVVVFLELPLRAGPFRAALVYGHPETWAGFWYIVLAQQFQGSLVDPFGDLGHEGGRGRRTGDPAARAARGARPVRVRRDRAAAAALRAPDRHHPGAHLLVRRVVRQRPDRALLPRPAAHRPDLARRCSSLPRATASSACSRRAGSIGMASRAGTPGRRVRARGTHRLPGASWSCPSAGGPSTSTRPRRRRLARRDPRRARRRTRRGRPLVVELLDPAMVRTADRGSTSGHPSRGRPDPPRRGPRRHRRRDRREPRHAARSSSSRWTRTSSRALRTRYHLTALPVPGDQPVYRVDGVLALGRRGRADERTQRRRGAHRAGPGPEAPTRRVATRYREPARGAVVLLPGPQRGVEPRAARGGGPGGPARRWPTGSRSSSSTTGRRDADGGDRRPAGRGPSGRRPGGPPRASTWATGRRCGRASGPPASGTWRSPTGIASSGSPTSVGSRRGWPGPTGPTSSIGYRIKRADPIIRTLYAKSYRLANRIFFGLRATDVDCACKLFRREALEGIRVESGGAFLSAELIIKLRARGRTVVEVGVPHHPRTAGSPTGAKPSVIVRAVRDFWLLRLRLWASPGRALPAARRSSGRHRRSTDPESPAVAEGRPRRYSGRGPSRVPASPPRSSELMKSRNTSRRGSAGEAESSVDSRSSIEPASPSSGRTAGAIEDLVGGEDPDAGPDGQGERVGRSRVDLELAVVPTGGRAGRGTSPRRATRSRPGGPTRRARRAWSRTGHGSAGAPTRRPGASSRSRSPPTGRSRSGGSARGRAP